MKKEFLNEPVKFTVDQIVKSKRFMEKQDLVHAVTMEGKTYTMDEVDELIQKYMKGKVK